MAHGFVYQSDTKGCILYWWVNSVSRKSGFLILLQQHLQLLISVCWLLVSWYQEEQLDLHRAFGVFQMVDTCTACSIKNWSIQLPRWKIKQTHVQVRFELFEQLAMYTVSTHGMAYRVGYSLVPDPSLWMIVLGPASMRMRSSVYCVGGASIVKTSGGGAALVLVELDNNVGRLWNLVRVHYCSV